MLTSRNKVGLTIAELLVATGLLAVVLVTVMVLFGQLIKSTTKNSLLSSGSFFADSVLEKHIALAQQRMASSAGSNPNDLYGFEMAGFTRAGDICSLEEGEGNIVVGDNDRATKFLYKIVAERVDGFLGDDPGQLWNVEIEVRWWHDSTAGAAKVRAGTGKLSIKRKRLVYLVTAR